MEKNKKMLITTAAFVMLMFRIVPAFRDSGFFILHMVLTIGASYLAERSFNARGIDIGIASKAAIYYSLLFHLIMINVVTFVTYGVDKSRAMKKQNRVKEAVLFAFAIFGGTPMAFVAQFFFRHKTKKKEFQSMFTLILVMQVIGIVGLLRFLT